MKYVFLINILNLKSILLSVNLEHFFVANFRAK